MFFFKNPIPLHRAWTGKPCWPKESNLLSCRQLKHQQTSVTLTRSSRAWSQSWPLRRLRSSSPLSSRSSLQTLTSMLCTDFHSITLRRGCDISNLVFSFLSVLFIQLFSPSRPPLSSAVESNEAGPVSPFKSCCSLFVKLAANMCLNSKDSPDWTLKPRGNHVITPDQNFAATTVS